MKTSNAAEIPTQRGGVRAGVDVGTVRLGARIRQAIVLVALGDTAVLVVSIAIAWQLRLLVPFGDPAARPGLTLAANAGPVIVAIWLLALHLSGSYSRRVFGAGTEEYRRVLVAASGTAGLVGLSCYLASVDLSRGFLFLAFAVGTPGLIAFRYAARQRVHRMRSKGRLVHRVIAVGGSHDVAEIRGILSRERHLGYEIVATCTPSGSDSHIAPEVPAIDAVGDVRDACASLRADTVLVARGGFESSGDLRRIAWDLEGSRVQLIVVPSLTEVAGPRIHMRPVAGLPLIHLQEPQSGGLAKRLFDAVGACLAIVLLAPLMAAMAIAILLEDGAPIMFRQRRIGWNGEAFGCFKFRSMLVDAEKSERLLREADGHHGALWKNENDPRITRVGRFIRRYSLDELPQLFNVVLGDMSLVGPRPQQGWEVDTYSDSTRRRLLVRPGMTGLWQVSGRSKLSFDEAVRLDLYYVDNWSLTTDLVIMAKTAKAVLSRDGAY